MKLNITNYLILASIFITGCTTAPVVSPVNDPARVWDMRQEALAKIHSWNISGRVAVNNGSEAWHMNMLWQQYNGNYLIQLSGPFGAGKVKLIGNEQGVELYDSHEQRYSAENPDKLLYETTGVRMPVEGMRFWIVGLAGPQNHGVTRLDEQGRLAYLEDSNWKVNFHRYMQVNDLELPRKIFIDRADNDINVRLVVDNWQLGLPAQ